MSTHLLPDALWNLIQPLLPPVTGHREADNWWVRAESEIDQARVKIWREEKRRNREGKREKRICSVLLTRLGQPRLILHVG
jgi:hypothetical protein